MTDGTSADLALGPEGQFWAFLREGRFMIQRSRSSGAYVFYPRSVAPATGAVDLEWTEASGLGHVYATTVIHRKIDRGGSYNLSIVQLTEGPRLMSRVVGIDPERVKIGMKVKACIKVPEFGPFMSGEQPIVLFEAVAPDTALPVGDSAGG